MPKRSSKAEERIADEIMSLFGEEDEYLLLTGNGSVHGIEGVHGLRLIGNCLYAEAYRGWAHKEADTTASAKRDRLNLARLETIQEALKKSEESGGARFVLCYHVGGTPEWLIAWSGYASKYEALEELRQFVQGGMFLEVDDIA